MPDYLPPQQLNASRVRSDAKPAVINYVAAIFAAFGSFLFGYDSGIIGSVISGSYREFHDYFKKPGAKDVSDGVTGAIVSLFAAGAFFGAIMAGYTADKFGRKRTIQIGSIIAIIGCTLQTAAVNVSMLIVGRFIAGWSIGVLSMIVPMYQAEISPPHTRGLLSGWTQLMIGWGFFVANWVGYGCGFLKTNAQWRIPLAIQIVPAVFLLFGMFLLPFSPRWLAKQGREEEAKATLIRLHGGRTAHIEIVEEEYREMLAQIEWERENLSTNVMDLVNTRPNLHRTICGCLVQAMCQWTGVNVGAYFGPTIYAKLGFAGQTTLMINGLSGAWGVITTFIFITFIVDKLGRRKPLIIGPILMAICLAWQSAIGKQFSQPGYSNYGAGIAGVASFFCFSWAFGWSFGPVSWIYQSEIFPMNLRAMGSAASTASNWLNNVIIGQVTPIGLNKLGWKYFMVFVVTNVTNAIVSYFLFPETKNKTLEEIGLLFGDTNVRVAPGMETYGVHEGKTEDIEKVDVAHQDISGHRL